MLPLLYIPAIQGAGFRKVYESTQSGTSFSFNIDPAKLYLLYMHVDVASTASAASYVLMQFNNDTNSADYRDGILYAVAGGVGQDYQTYSGTASGIRFVRLPGFGADVYALAWILPARYDPGSSAYVKSVLSLFTGAGVENGTGSGSWKTATAPPSPLPVTVTVSDTSIDTIQYLVVYEVVGW